MTYTAPAIQYESATAMPVAMSAQTTTYAMPGTTMSPHVTTYGAPQMAAPQVQFEQAPMTAQSTTYAPPAVSYDQTSQVSYAMSTQNYATPTQYAAPVQQFSTAPMTAAYAGQPQVAQVQNQQHGQSLFDMMDRNHDGVITRQEFNQFMR